MACALSLLFVSLPFFIFPTRLLVPSFSVHLSVFRFVRHQRRVMLLRGLVHDVSARPHHASLSSTLSSCPLLLSLSSSSLSSPSLLPLFARMVFKRRERRQKSHRTDPEFWRRKMDEQKKALLSHLFPSDSTACLAL